MSYIEHAMREFESAGWINEGGVWDDDMQQSICEQVIDLLRLFGEHGHSGTTAPYAAGLFKDLAMFKPIRPLTGKDSEWTKLDYGEDMMWQNKRCSHVFKGSDGRAYDGNGKVFREPDGCCYTSSESRVYIDFPYTPKIEYVDVEGDRECGS